MNVELKRPYIELKPEYQELYDQFIEYEHYGCYCHSCPPCGWCTDEGNPQNLNETDEAWVNEKKCIKCKETKPLDYFYKRKQHKDGLNGKCKECLKEYNLSIRTPTPRTIKRKVLTHRDDYVEIDISTPSYPNKITKIYIDDYQRIFRDETYGDFLLKHAGKGSKTFYVRVNIRGTNKYRSVHNLIYPEYKTVDHINGNGLDNRRENLREATDSLNRFNVGLRSNNKSGVIGVHWNETHKRWVPTIRCNNKSIYLGRFTDFDEAVQARLDAEMKYFGESPLENRMIISEKDIKPLEPLADEDQNYPDRGEPEYLPDGVTLEECREAMDKCNE